jgi:hypothetical protein
MLNAKKGNNETAFTMCDSLKSVASSEGVRYGDFALIHAIMGKKEEMYKYIHKAIEYRESIHDLLIDIQNYTPLQEDKEFQKIEKEILILRSD